MRDISIIGGGLAGLVLGIALRRQRVPVTIFEAGVYPRQRVCGEFISGKGLMTLKRLGLLESLLQAGAREVKTVAFYSEHQCYMRRAFGEGAGLAIARWTLDATLADEFRRLGGDLRVGSKWQGDHSLPGVVRATGRRRAASADQSRWFGVKAHLHGALPEADLEMHFLKDGYVGLCRLTDDRVNACGMFAAGRHKGNHLELLRGPVASMLQQRLGDAEWERESLSAVAGLPLHRRIEHTDEARVGDAVAMVPPVTGNGMSFAFESAEIAAAPISAYSANGGDWGELVRQLRRDYCAAFGQRLFWANMFHKTLLWSRRTSLALGCGNPVGWHWCFRMTR